jgi:Glycosyltransferase (GlcNAc)
VIRTNQRTKDLGLLDSLDPDHASSFTALAATPIKTPKRYEVLEKFDDPPPLAEIERNLTLYLHTLHDRLGALAGPKVDAPIVWETYLEITKNMVMKWDDENRHRFPTPRKDGSIFVSLGTYRDPYCPMTIKSLYSQAKYPERLYVGLLQQNCFETVCRTGVLKGGLVEDTSTDMNCYTEFCNSPGLVVFLRTSFTIDPA